MLEGSLEFKTQRSSFFHIKLINMCGMTRKEDPDVQIRAVTLGLPFPQGFLLAAPNLAAAWRSGVGKGRHQHSTVASTESVWSRSHSLSFGCVRFGDTDSQALLLGVTWPLWPSFYL